MPDTVSEIKITTQLKAWLTNVLKIGGHTHYLLQALQLLQMHYDEQTGEVRCSTFLEPKSTPEVRLVACECAGITTDVFKLSPRETLAGKCWYSACCNISVALFTRQKNLCMVVVI